MPSPSMKTSETPAKTFTNWEVFERANLVPENIQCNGYKPAHIVDSGCHSNVIPAIQNILGHIANGHGGGFLIRLKQTEGKPWKGWKDLADAGVEIHDFRCDVCDKSLKLSPAHIFQHLKAHTGKMRRPIASRIFGFTLGLEKPLDNTDEEI